MSLVYYDKGVAIYRCPKCAVNFRWGKGQYQGRAVGEEIWCNSCAPPTTEPMTEAELKKLLEGATGGSQ